MSHESQINELVPDRLSMALQAALREPTPADPVPSLELRAALTARLETLSSSSTSSVEVTPMSTSSSQSGWGRVAATLVASVVAAGVAIAIFLPANQDAREAERSNNKQLALAIQDDLAVRNSDKLSNSRPVNVPQVDASGIKLEHSVIMPTDPTVTEFSISSVPSSAEPATTTEFLADTGDTSAILGPSGNTGNGNQVAGRTILGREKKAMSGGGQAYSGLAPNAATHPFQQGGYREGTTPALPGIGFNPAQNATSGKPASGAAATAKPLPAIKTPGIIIQEEDAERLLGIADPRPALVETDSRVLTDRKFQSSDGNSFSPLPYERQDHPSAQLTGEQYEQRVENIFQGVRAEPLSTFSIDVDTASYANCRRFLNGNQLPPTAAVRVEEFINYFRYDYPQPTGKDPFSVNMEVADCPWTPGHKLLRVGLKGKEIDNKERPASNLVFLVDVSGSMSSEDKLPLLCDAMHRWVNELTSNDRVTIVTYAGNAGLRLPTTRGNEKDKLHAAIETLQSGGSTDGSAGIKLAYEQATENFLENGGVNRVLWATDGDLNVGTTGDDELVDLITKQAKTGVFLTVLGVGTGNLKDAKLEKMADHGNGVYAYLDSPKEARKVLIEQMSGTTITIAKDVKIQIEFNPAEIAGYRLIGYENRMLATEDFANDKKDAGEIGAGHTVTALYEIIPVDTAQELAPQNKEQLKYQDAQTSPVSQAAPEPKLSAAAKSGELLTLKLRFKQPDAHESVLREFPLTERGGKFTAASKDFQFAGCVAQLAMILRDSQYRGTMTTAAIAEIAAATTGTDKDGSRREFVELVKKVQQLGK